MRIKPLVVLSLVCSLSQAADTVASLGDSIKATQFVTAVDHSHITDGTGKVYFVDGIPYADIVTTTTIVERQPVSVWFYPNPLAITQYTPPWSSIKVEVDYSSWTNSSEQGISSGRRIKDIVSPNNYLYVSGYSGNPDPEGGCIYTHDPNVEVPYVGELAQVFPGQAVVCSFYMRDAGNLVPCETQTIYTNYTETAITVLETNSYRIATTADIQPTNGLASMVWVNSKKWDWSTQILNKPTNVSAFNNDAGYVTANHTHSNLVNGITEVIANADGTASIVNTTELYGFNVSARTKDQSRSSGEQPILIEMEIPVPLATFSDAMLRSVQSIRLRICEPLVGSDPVDIVPWQTVALDHTKFGGPESQWFGIADNAITQVNSEWFTTINPGYNWINDIYNAPFRINCENATVSSLYTSWGPIGSTVEDVVTTDLFGKQRQIATIDNIQPIAESIARQIVRDAVSSVSTDVQTAEDARVALTNLITILKNL